MTKVYADATDGHFVAILDDQAVPPVNSVEVAVAPPQDRDLHLYDWNGLIWVKNSVREDTDRGNKAEVKIGPEIEVIVDLFMDMEARMRGAGQVSTIPEVAAATNRASYRQALKTLLKAKLS